MGNIIYQLVYKSSYHGELYSDPRAVPLPPEVAVCPAAEIMEILKLETPDNDDCLQSFDSAGMSFPDLASAVAAMKTMTTIFC